MTMARIVSRLPSLLFTVAAMIGASARSAVPPDQERLRLESLEDRERLAICEAAIRNARTDEVRLDTLGNWLLAMARTEFKARATESGRRAEQYAREALHLADKLSVSWNCNNEIHHGHLLLGHLALDRGDRETARTELRAAGDISGSPQLGSFGPNMALVRQLLELGERAPALDYFEQCRRFWKSQFSKLDTWKAQVEAGRIPDFGANLGY